MTRLLGVLFDEPRDPMAADALLRSFLDTPGLYLHVPFCERLCPFCPYNKVPYHPSLADAYFAAVDRELDRCLEVHPGPFESLYVGGGTPTLCLDHLERLVGRLPVSGARAIEVLPSHVSPGTVDHLRSLGFSQVSLGVQSFDDEALRRLHRPTTAEQNRRALETAVGAFPCVDVDLIFDVAYRKPDRLLDDLEICFRAGVDQVSTYPLMRFGYTPFGKAPHHRRAEHRLLRRATELAATYGYERRTVWSFNRPTAPSYTSITRQFYLGLGAGAATYTGPLWWVNHFGIDRYLAAVEAGGLPVARIARLRRSQAAAYWLFWQAYAGRLPLQRCRSLFGSHLPASAAIGLMRAAGWLAPAPGGDLLLTRRGFDRFHDLERWVTYHLIEPLWAELMAEHHATVPGPPPAAVGRRG